MEYRISFYNLENVFDTKDDPKTFDDDFLPDSDLNWTNERYERKISNLSNSINALNKGKIPLFIGYCEAENVQVTVDLKQNLSFDKEVLFIQHDSPDERGIDVGLFYNRNHFNPIKDEVIAINFPNDHDKTRDILHVKGKIVGSDDMIHVFVNHWPSRGNPKNASKREYIAHLLKQKIESIQQAFPNDQFILMGDFNDEPFNQSLLTLSNENNIDQLAEDGLFNLMFNELADGKGSYNYRGNWNVMDQFLVSKNLLSVGNWNYQVKNDEAFILDSEAISYYDKRDQVHKPSRTYSGPKYYGGWSDHYPIYFDLVKRD